MSLLKKFSYHDDVLKEKEKANKEALLLNNNNNNNRRRKLSLTKSISNTDLEKWAKSKKTELTILRDWLKKQPHLPQTISDEQILMFLHSCYDSIEQAKGKIDSFYTIRTHAPEIFTDRKEFSKDMIQAQKMTRISPLRGATPEGYNAIFIDCVDPDISNFNFTGAMKAASVAIDALVSYYPQEEGNIIVFDMQNSALAHVIKTNMTVLKKAMVYVQSALPFRMKQVHVINAFPLIQQIQLMLKPFIDQNLSKMIHIHMQNNMDTFYDCIPKKNLPKDYGGEAESLQELNDKLREIIAIQRPYLAELERHVVDEGKRSGRAKTSSDVFGMEGSFRKLELD